MEKIGIVGVGQTTYERSKEAPFDELVFEAASKALKDAGGEMGHIDNIITVSNDFWDGRTISSMAVMDAAGSWGKGHLHRRGRRHLRGPLRHDAHTLRIL